LGSATHAFCIFWVAFDLRLGVSVNSGFSENISVTYGVIYRVTPDWFWGPARVRITFALSNYRQEDF